MTKLEKARNKIIRAAVAMHDGHDDNMIRELLDAVEWYLSARTLDIAARRKRPKPYKDAVYVSPAMRRKRARAKRETAGR